MLDRLTPLTHLIRMLIKPALHDLGQQETLRPMGL
jgi:hypothetical protein